MHARVFSTSRRFPSYLLLPLLLSLSVWLCEHALERLIRQTNPSLSYFLFNFYLPRCILSDFPSISSLASLPFSSCCHWTTTICITRYTYFFFTVPFVKRKIVSIYIYTFLIWIFSFKYATMKINNYFYSSTHMSIFVPFLYTYMKYIILLLLSTQ